METVPTRQQIINTQKAQLKQQLQGNIERVKKEKKKRCQHNREGIYHQHEQQGRGCIKTKPKSGTLGYRWRSGSQANSVLGHIAEI